MKRYIAILFLAFLCVSSCKKEDELQVLGIDYLNGKAVAVRFRTSVQHSDIGVFLGDESETAVLGEIQPWENIYQFRPVVPFTSNITYTFRRKDKKVLANFAPIDQNSGKPPEILAIYPSKDAVPENLLKLHVQFSEPMQSVGSALDYIKVIDNTSNEQVSIFLALESELWNQEHDLLTLWLDPGRIKTGLIPNKTQGLPLKEGHQYAIQFSKEWKSAQGVELKQPYFKNLVVVQRDGNRPKPQDWTMETPNPNTKDPLTILFNETMDAILAKETIHIKNEIGEEINGKFTLLYQETAVRFEPLENWDTGKFKIEVESRFEDLAGNNLNRLFDKKVENFDMDREVLKEIEFLIK
ncbi:hypothetical protein [Flagellimonas allohymeniacidonis]|uniref:SbsA Ig-like domain-containing protein n=1 Tax=Flagellimonas allohymeniacidonis TaxID=2517819 RepID=A0A4V2HS78_9FLAO|nr:hypothetical protein [Allomuricauda hymeniacidonis]TAI46660.1 hypothetical protein EW142_16420 [Allomuricauda hymeniacidonis]